MIKYVVYASELRAGFFERERFNLEEDAIKFASMHSIKNHNCPVEVRLEINVWFTVWRQNAN